MAASMAGGGMHKPGEISALAAKTGEKAKQRKVM